MTKHLNKDDLPALAQAWSGLQRYAPLHPIQNETDFERICELADLLVDTIGGDSSHPLYSMFQLTMSLIEHWEDEHVHLPKVHPREVLRHLLEANDLKHNDLEGIASEKLVSDILAGRQEISRELAATLAERFRVDIAAFL